MHSSMHEILHHNPIQRDEFAGLTFTLLDLFSANYEKSTGARTLICMYVIAECKNEPFPIKYKGFVVYMLYIRQGIVKIVQKQLFPMNLK